MLANIKAIETKYKGYRFRSRLEARWAVFFDSVGVKWEYEKEGYKLRKRQYLPDFYLPELQLWVEIKGTNEDARIAKDEIWEVGAITGKPIAICVGMPHEIDMTIFIADTTSSAGGVGWRNDFRFAIGLNGKLCLFTDDDRSWFDLNWAPYPTIKHVVNSFPLMAFDNAKATRFEHGECP